MGAGHLNHLPDRSASTSKGWSASTSRVSPSPACSAPCEHYCDRWPRMARTRHCTLMTHIYTMAADRLTSMNRSSPPSCGQVPGPRPRQSRKRQAGATQQRILRSASPPGPTQNVYTPGRETGRGTDFDCRAGGLRERDNWCKPSSLVPLADDSRLGALLAAVVHTRRAVMCSACAVHVHLCELTGVSSQGHLHLLSGGKWWPTASTWHQHQHGQKRHKRLLFLGVSCKQSD